MAMIVIPALLAVLIIGFALREIFHDLFHPSVGGSLSGMIGRGIFNLLRHWPRSLSFAGPLALVIVIFSWALLLAAGFAIVYWALAPSYYRVDAGTAVPHHNVLAAFYFSLEVMTTLGLGDIKPQPGWFSVFVVLHTLIGFTLVTASLSWVILIFPAISRTNRLARLVSIVVRAERNSGIPAISADSEWLLAQLTTGLITVRIDLVHFPLVYYFRSVDENACLAHVIGHIGELAGRASSPSQPERMRLAAAALTLALNDCAQILSSQFPDIQPGEPADVFRSYAAHHRTPAAW